MPSAPKPLSKTKIAGNTGAALDDAKDWQVKVDSAPIPDVLVDQIGASSIIPISSIVEDHALQKYGLSFDPEKNSKHKSLLESIRKYGVQVPICVKEIQPGQYRIVYGHKRVISSKLVGLKTIPAIIAKPQTNDTFLHLLENLFRTEPSTFDNASAARALLEMEISPGVRYSRDEVASVFNWTKDWLDQVLDILNAPAPLVDFFRAGADPKLLRPVWVQVRKSGKSPQEQQQVCSALRGMGINALEPFTVYSRDKGLPITEAVAKVQSEMISSNTGNMPSVPVALKKATGRPKGSRGSSRKAAAQVMGHRLWDPIWLQKNGNEAKDMLIRITGISSAKADSLVFSHSAGTGCSLGLAILAALAMSHTQSSSKPLDEKSALEYAKKLYIGPPKSSHKLMEQYLSVVSILPDMMDELRSTDKLLYDFAVRIFGIRVAGRKPVPQGKKVK